MKEYTGEFEDFSQVDLEASEWLAKMDRGLSGEEQDQFTEWMGSSQDNRDAIALHDWGWTELDRLAGLKNVKKDLVDKDLLDPALKSCWTERPTSFWRGSKPWVQSIGIAAATLLMLSPFAFFKNDESNPIIEPFDSSKIQSIQKRILPDGSHVELNINSDIKVEYSGKRRLVKLLKGEAIFDVQKDLSRPFVVEAQGVNVRAVGTVFNVRLSDDQVNVVVAEGTVALMEENTVGVDTANLDTDSFVTESQKAVVSSSQGELSIEIYEIDQEEIHDELLWRPELLEFDNVYLREIVHEFNRRNSMKILLADSSLDHLQLSAVFWSDNVEGFVRLLESEFSITAYIAGERKILLSSE